MEEFKKRIIEESKAYEFNADEVIELLTPHYQILEWLTEHNKVRMTPNKYKKHIQFTQDTFLELNAFVKNDGYTKLSKRCKYVLNQLELYENKKPLHPNMKAYFDKTFGVEYPSKNNIYSIATDNLRSYTLEDKWAKGGSEYSKDIISHIFDIGRFNISLKYEAILIKNNDKYIHIELSNHRLSKIFSMI